MAAPYPSFPASPTIGQTYTDANGAVWTFGNIGWTKTLVSLTSDPSIWQDIDSVLNYDSSGNVTITGGLTAGGKVSIPLGTAPLPSLYFGTDTNTGIYSPGADQVGIATNGTSRLVVDASGNVNIDAGTFYVDAVNNRVGIGTTGPAQFLHLKGSGDVKLLLNSTNNASDRGIYFAASTDSDILGYIKQEYSTGKFEISSGSGTYASSISFRTGGISDRLTLDASGNLGLGVTPSAWATLTAFELNGGSLSAYSTTQAFLSQNTYYNAGWKYKTSAKAMQYLQDTNGHQWYTAPSGTAGAAITFTQAMTLSAAGYLGIGATSPGSPLTVESSAGNQVKITYPSIASYYLNVTSAGALDINKDGTSQLVIDSSGRLLVGTTSSPGAGELLRVEKATTGTEGAGIRFGGTYTIADNGTQTFTIGNSALVFVSNNTTGNGALFFCSLGSATISLLSDPDGVYATSVTAGKVSLTKTTSSATITLTNKSGASRSFTIGKINNSD